MKHFLSTLILGVLLAIPCYAGPFSHACPHCGCCQIKKVCRLVPDVKKVTEFKYTVTETEICLPGKSCVEEQTVPDPCAPCGQRCEKVQIPQCGRVVCQKKLKKSPVTVEKPIVKCVVDTICCQCGGNCDTGECAP